MTIEILSSREAYAQVFENGAAHWPSRDARDSRLAPVAQPAFHHSFQLIPGEKIFTIGSCFARNIENELAVRGFAVATKDVIVKDPEFARVGPNVLNNYGVPSIFNELSWALDPSDTFDEDSGFYEVYPDKFVDLHLNQTMRPAPIELCRTRRRILKDVYKSAADSRVIVMTLGLTEVWFDKTARRYVNVAPRKSVVRQSPDRFELHVLEFRETLEYLMRIFRLLRQACPRTMHVLLSVSPVPIMQTFRKLDVMEANTYSKAVLRAAAEKIRSTFSFVDYYPSFESIVLSERAAAWKVDNVHPTDEIVELNCTRMIEAYTRDARRVATAVELRSALKSMAPHQIFGALEFRRELLEEDDDLAIAFAQAAVQARKFDVAAEAVHRFAPTDSRVALLRAVLLIEGGRGAEAIALLADEPADKMALRRHLLTRLRAELAVEHFTAAQGTAARFTIVSPRSNEPFRLLGIYASKRGDVEAADNYFSQALALADDSPALMLDYVEHLARTGRQAEAEAFLEHVDPGTSSHQLRIERLRSGLVFDLG